MQRLSIIILQYAGFLLVCGLASVLYSAETRTAGWNGHGVSGLIACGSAAVIMGVLGFLAGKGKEIAVWIALGLAFMLLSYGGYKFFGQMRDVPTNAAQLVVDREKAGAPLTQDAAERTIVYKSIVFGVMALFSLSAFMRLGLAVRHGRQA